MVIIGFAVGAHSSHSDEGGDDHSGHDHRFLQDGHEGHDDSSESVNAAKFGCAILGGFLLPMLFAIFFPNTNDLEQQLLQQTSPIVPASISTSKNGPATAGREGDEDGCDTCSGQNASPNVEATMAVAVDSDTSLRKAEEDPLQENRRSHCDLCEEGDHEPEQPKRGIGEKKKSILLVDQGKLDMRLATTILIGDGFHNFADGIFIGAAFSSQSCSIGTALMIVLVTVFHEIAQELADFILLTRYCGLSVVKACALNFISGLTVCLGGIVYLATNPSEEATGIVLAMAAGVYFYIAACDAFPRIDKIANGRVDRALTLFSVIIGTVPIGLVLLNHQHC